MPAIGCGRLAQQAASRREAGLIFLRFAKGIGGSYEDSTHAVVLTLSSALAFCANAGTVRTFSGTGYLDD